MCGICGVIAADQRLIEPAVADMMQAMRHRGPDDGGFELLPLGLAATGPYAGFGFRRLSILDLSPAGHQPMFNPATGDCLVFNGEIYNFRDLRAELASTGVSFRSTGDTEVLLHALSTWREAALGRLHGMFALAFYHAQSRRILLARDPLGIKPLYVATGDRGFVFASEIRAVQASGLVAEDLDVAGIAGMLAYGAIQTPRTVFKAIRSFPAGAYQWIDAEVATGQPPAMPRRYWNFAKTSLGPESHEVTVREVKQRLHDAVLRHLVADVPVGVFLSAGIDSTIVASLAREYTPRVTAFTVGFDSLHGQDEVPIAAATARELGIDHVTLSVSQHSLHDDWHSWLDTLDSPSIDGFNTYVVSRLLAAANVVVGLSGLGADELFGGYYTFTRAPRLSSLVRALRFIPPALRSATVAAIGRFDGRSGAFHKLADLVAGDSSVAGVTLAMRRALANSSLHAMGLCSEALGLRADYLDVSNPKLEIVYDDDDFNTVSRTELVHYVGDTLLRDTDANSMRHSLEVRVPFLDVPLVDYVSGLPGPAKQRGAGAVKSLLRDVGKEVLSYTVLNRPKTGFTLPLGDWMRGVMRESCAAAVETVADLPFLEGGAVRAVWNTFLKDERSVHWSRPLAIVALGSYLAKTRSGCQPC